jgi:FAD:protein FMN transferase
MKLVFSLAAVAAATAISFAGIGARNRMQPWHTFHYENVLGTSMELKVGASSLAEAEIAEAAVLSEIRRLNGILSGYDSSSEFSRWSRTRGQAVRVSPELFEVLGLWDAWRDRTGGALDASAEAVSRVWKAASKASRLPSESELQTAVGAVRQAHWKLDAASGAATRLSDTPLMLNSFTKSWVVERAAAAALATGSATAIVLNIGGDLVVRGAAHEPVDIADPLSDSENSAPLATIDVRDIAVATSGDYRRGFDIGGRHYSHIVDPRNGRPVQRIVSATVAADCAVDAGALATAFTVLSPEESRRLAASVPGAQYLLVDQDGAEIASPGWKALELPRISAAAQASPLANSFAAAPQAGSWNAGFELNINLELAQAEGFGARRPYVAVWIEDKDRFPVRTLALWFNSTRWLPEMRAWYRSDRLRAVAEGGEIINSVSSATRPPGKYSFKWDGKDNSGKPVKAGPYTVMIEVSREHGTYQLIRHEMDLNGTPAQMQFPANPEIAASSVDYRKVAH